MGFESLHPSHFHPPSRSLDNLVPLLALFLFSNRFSSIALGLSLRPWFFLGSWRGGRRSGCGGSDRQGMETPGNEKRKCPLDAQAPLGLECFRSEWRYRLGVRTGDSQSSNRGSNPRSAAKFPRRRHCSTPFLSLLHASFRPLPWSATQVCPLISPRAVHPPGDGVLPATGAPTNLPPPWF